MISYAEVEKQARSYFQAEKSQHKYFETIDTFENLSPITQDGLRFRAWKNLSAGAYYGDYERWLKDSQGDYDKFVSGAV